MKLEKARCKHGGERCKIGVNALPQADIFCPTVVGRQVRPRQVLWAFKFSTTPTIDWVIFQEYDGKRPSLI